MKMGRKASPTNASRQPGRNSTPMLPLRLEEPGAETRSGASGPRLESLLRAEPMLSAPVASAPVCDLIESENLKALHVLGHALRASVHVIYIDPPYNTGSQAFSYTDRQEARGADAQHASWSAFMRERLLLSAPLLRDDGVIFISIDDNEQARLRLLCDEVLGENNFVAQFVWHKTRKGKALSRTARLVTEYVLCYARDYRTLSRKGLWGSPADADLANPFFHRPNRPAVAVFPPGSIETNWADGDYEAGLYGPADDTLSPTVISPFSIAGGLVVTELRLRGRFRWQQSTLDKELASGARFALRKGKFRLVFFRDSGHKAPPTLLDDRCGVGTYEEASAEVTALLGHLPFVYPKPVSLIQFLIRAATHGDPHALVLDFFAGTGTTGHAVAALNALDGGARRCILITDNSGKQGKQFIPDAGDEGICRSIARKRLMAAFSGRGDVGRVAPTSLCYWRLLDSSGSPSTRGP